MRAVVGLGVLSPGLDVEAKGLLAQTEATAEQVVADIIFLGEAGYEVGELYAQLNSERDQLVALRAEISTMSDEDFAGWKSQLSALSARLDLLLDNVVRLRQKRTEGLRFQGLWLGLGTAFAVAGASVLVWRGRKRRRSAR